MHQDYKRAQILIPLLLILVPHGGFAQSFKFAEEHPFKSGISQGKVEISLDQSVLQKGKLSHLDYRFTNTNGSYQIYNWKFMRGLDLPGQLVIYDSNHNYIGNLLDSVWESRGRAQLTDWITLDGGSYVGASLGFRVGSARLTKYMAEGSLPTGTYYIQLVLYRAFVSERPYLTEEVVEDLRRKFDRSELCRSNVIKVEITDK